MSHAGFPKSGGTMDLEVGDEVVIKGKIVEVLAGGWLVMVDTGDGDVRLFDIGKLKKVHNMVPEFGGLIEEEQ